MRPILNPARGLAIAVVVGLGAVTAVPAQAAPASSFSATLTDNGACLFTLTATWKNAHITQVNAFWYLDGVYWATSQAPGTGPNGGTLKGRKAVVQAGPATPSAETHDWSLLVQYYDGPVFVSQQYSNIDTVTCSLG